MWQRFAQLWMRENVELLRLIWLRDPQVRKHEAWAPGVEGFSILLG